MSSASGSKRARMARVSRPPRSLVGDRTMVTLKTSYAFTHSGAGLHASVFHPTVARNPFGTVSSNQPRGFDEYTAFYQRALVHSFKISVKAISLSSSVSALFALVLSPGSSNTDTSVFRMGENPNAGTRIALHNAHEVALLSRATGVAKIYGVSELDYSDFSASNTGTLNPDRMVYARLASEAFDGTSSESIRFLVTITQRVEFYDKFPVLPS